MFEGIDFDERCKNEIFRSIMNGTLAHAVILEGSKDETRLAAAKEIAERRKAETTPISSFFKKTKAQAPSKLTMSAQYAKRRGFCPTTAQKAFSLSARLSL